MAPRLFHRSLMHATAARLLRIQPVPASTMPRAVAAGSSGRPMPRADAAPSVADQLLAMPHRPPNLRMEPFVHGKSRYWKVRTPRLTPGLGKRARHAARPAPRGVTPAQRQGQALDVFVLSVHTSIAYPPRRAARRAAVAFAPTPPVTSSDEPASTIDRGARARPVPRPRCAGRQGHAE